MKLQKSPDLIDVDANPDCVAGDKKDDDGDEEHCDPALPSIAGGHPAAAGRGVAHRLPQHQVHHRDQHERHQQHHDEVSCEDVIPAHYIVYTNTTENLAINIVT